MATPTPPNNPNQPPKKPADATSKPNTGGNGQSTPGAKPGQPTGQKPTQGATGAPVSKPGVPVSKPGQPAGAKPGAPAGGKPAQPAPGKKPQPAKNRFSHIDANTLQLAKKLEDLGFLDGAQLETLYEEMRTSDARLGELAIQRGLLTEEQLLQATAEVHGMRVANLEEVKPAPDAVKLVTKQMAELYKLVPLSYENDTLTVAMADPNNLQAMDDLRNLLGIRQVSPVLAPPKQIDMLLAKAYSTAKE